jgi:hypothetical protein
MKKIFCNLLSMLAAIITIAVALNFASVNAFADDEEECSAATLHGSYGIQTTGSIVANGPIGPVAEAGIIKFDGVSKVSQTTTVSLNGTILPNRSSLSGAYQVYPDCTGDVQLVLPGAPGTTITSTLHFVIVDNGKELRLVNTGEGRVLVSNARRQ